MATNDSSPNSQFPTSRRSSTFASQQKYSNPTSQNKFESTPHSIDMARTDSGFEDGTADSHRRSTSTSNSSRRRRTHEHNTSFSSSSSRPTAKRSARSTPSTRLATRPTVQTRYSTSATSQYQFFQFPTLADSVPKQSQLPSHLQQETLPIQTLPPPPPVTVNYWTSSETRRLEYAAIDAASRGVRGFVTRLLPDCILPCEYRRTKFHCAEDDVDSDAGSVRRYRLSLPEEKTPRVRSELDMAGEGQDAAGRRSGDRRLGLIKRLTSFGRH